MEIKPKTTKSRTRRMRALWHIAKPTPTELLATGCLALIWLVIVVVI